MVDAFVEMFEMEIVQLIGMSGTRLVENAFGNVLPTLPKSLFGKGNLYRSKCMLPKRRVGRLIFEKYFENAPATLCSILQNLRLGSIKWHRKIQDIAKHAATVLMLPERRFCEAVAEAEPSCTSHSTTAFSTHVSRV
jgi:hypothetical protein